MITSPFFISFITLIIIVTILVLSYERTEQELKEENEKLHAENKRLKDKIAELEYAIEGFN